MLIKTILNRVQKHACFIYSDCRLVEKPEKMIIAVDIKARANSQPICSGCGLITHSAPNREFCIPIL